MELITDANFTDELSEFNCYLIQGRRTTVGFLTLTLIPPGNTTLFIPFKWSDNIRIRNHSQLTLDSRSLVSL